MSIEAEQPFKWFGIRQTAKRFDRVAFQLGLGRQSVSANAVHDLRVSIRRLLAALGCFSCVFEKEDSRELIARVEKVLDAAGDVRDYDIALELAEESGLDPGCSLVKSLADQRRQRAMALGQELRRGGIRKFSIRWRQRLGLS